MKLAIQGNYGSGKTAYLLKKAKEFSNPYYLKNYDQLINIAESMSGNKIIIKSFTKDYIYFIIYKKVFENRGYNSFSKFLRDVKQLINYLNILGISLDHITSQNKIFMLFAKEYQNILIKLNHHEMILQEQVVAKYIKEVQQLLQNYDVLIIDDLDSFPFNVIDQLLSLHENILVAYTQPFLAKKISYKKFKIHTLPQNTLPSPAEEEVESIPLHIYLHLNKNLKNIGFYTTKNTRRKVENFLRAHKKEIQENTEITVLYDYAISQKYFKSNIHKPESWEILEKINRILQTHDSYIFEFLENYEDVFFYSLPNIHSSPYELYGKKYDILYIEEKSLKSSKEKETNLLIPWDFISYETLEKAQPFSNPAFFMSKARKIILLKEQNEEIEFKVRITTNNKPPTEISFSQVSTYEDCPYKYFLRYVLKIPEEPTPALIFGTIIHTLLERYAKKEISASKMFELFENMMHRHLSSFKTLTHYYLLKGKKMLKNFLKAEDKIIAQQYENKGIEMNVTLKLEENIKIIGKIDRIVQIKDKIVVIDYKTSKPPKSVEDVKKGLEQLALYSYILKTQYQMPVEKAFLWYLDNNKIVEMEGEDISKLLFKIKDTSHKIKNSEFSPKPGTHCKSCSYRLLCKYWQGVKRK